MNGKKGFILFSDIAEPINNLSDEDAGKLIKAIFAYQNGGVTTDLPVAASVAFNFIKLQMDRSNEHYEKVCERNRKNIQDYWNKVKDTTVYDRIDSNTNVNDGYPLNPNPKPKPGPKPKPRRKKEEKKDLSPDGEPLWQKMENAFLSRMNEADYSWGIERKALNALVKKAEARENPEEFAHALLNTFWKMTKRKEKFWADQAFLPHTLNGVSIYPQVVKEMEKATKQGLSQEDKDFIRGMKF